MVQNLATVVLNRSPAQEDHFEMAARVFASLRRAVHDLSRFYASIKPSAHPHADHRPVSYRNFTHPPDSPTPDFTYNGPIEDRERLFEAEERPTLGGNKLVVKFNGRY